MFEKRTAAEYFFTGQMLVYSIMIPLFCIAWISGLWKDGRIGFALSILIVPIVYIVAGLRNLKQWNDRAERQKEKER